MTDLLISPTQSPSTSRVMVIWCPDWPVIAAMVEEELPAQLPIAVIWHNQVYACSQQARFEGVRRGMRRRDASATCPDLVLVDHNPDRDLRAFEDILAVVEEVSPGVAPIRPGLCALGVPSRYYGGEPQAAAVLAERLVTAGVWDCRIGIADGIFAAEQAARRSAPQDSCIIASGGSAAFLSELPIGVLEDAEMVSLLRRLGLRSLGDFAGLSPRDVLTRFGRDGAWHHRLARGLDTRSAAGRTPPPELDAYVDFSPPLEVMEPIVFSVRQTAERFVAELYRHGLVCTTARIEIVGDGSWNGSRRWAHPRWFGAADLVDRVHWQLQADPPPEPVTGVRLVPEAVESMADQGEGLWGSAPDERINRGVARLQSMLGHEAVLSPSLQGGRDPRGRQVATPWGERTDGLRRRGLPWPGSIPPPAPSRVFAEPRPATVLGADHQPVGVTSRGMVTTEPMIFQADQNADLMRIEAWAGPWPIDELWWDPSHARQVARFQLVGVDGSAWLLVVEDSHWWTEAQYA
ncbi:MAG TPA: DNA polymerase Y family protein [Propionibacteriaceae bacterium]|nr:DNA polymerase Y family protein [Propionibacteriaceae bacterium]